MPGKFCCASTCRITLKNAKRFGFKLRFFSFPRDELRRKQWRVFCEKSDDWNPKNSVVCSAHFKEEDFLRDFRNELLGLPLRLLLTATAVPTIHYKISSQNIPSRVRTNEDLFDLTTRDDCLATQENKPVLCGVTRRKLLHCHRCSISFTSHQKLKYHFRAHLLNGECPHCFFDGETRQCSLTYHLQAKHSNEQCPCCNVIIKNILRHLIGNTGKNKKHECGHCGYCTLSSTGMLVHLRKVHNG